MDSFDYIIVIQCQLAQQRCSGYHCERAFHDRIGGFAGLPKDRTYRTLYTNCGGCCGKAVQRKLENLVKKGGRDGVAKDKILVQLASCITKDNHHSPRCPHADFIRELVARAGLTCREDTKISATAEARRKDGTYKVTKTVAGSQ